MKKGLTPHNEAQIDEIAKTVLMPGDPLRAEFIANTFLENAVKVNNVRGINGYTGFYKGKKVTVMASGMGMPSMGIYSYELYNFYKVENIIRIGTAGAIDSQLELRDIAIGMGACTNSNYAMQYNLPGTYAPIASYELVAKAVEQAKAMKLNYKVGNVLSADTFYDDNPEFLKSWEKMGVLCVEMEAAALFMNAARANKKALCLCTISDKPFTGEGCTAIERQNSFKDMMILALEIAE